MQRAEPSQPEGGWVVYHFITRRGESVIIRWLRKERVSARQRGTMQDKINALESGGEEMVPGLIVGPVAPDIYKMKIKGNRGDVQLRPHLCRGPFSEREFTLLAGAVEKDRVLRPRDVAKRSQENRTILLENPERRRHERIERES